MEGTTQPNPAARLASVLDGFKRQNPKDSLRNAWATVFGIDPNETGPILLRLAELVHLAHQARQAVQAAVGDDDPSLDLYIRPYDKLERALSRLNFDAHAQQTLNEIDATCLQGIRFGADMLGRLGLVGTIDEDLLSGLQEEVERLSELVLASDLPSEVRDLLARRVEAVRDAILSIRLRGAEAVEAALDALYGAVGRAREPMQQSGGKKLFEQFEKVLDIGYRVTAMATRISQISAPVLKLLVPG